MAKLADKLARSKVGGLFFKSDEDIPDTEARFAQPETVQQSRPMPASFGVGMGGGVVPSFTVAGFTTVSLSVDLETKTKIQSIADGVDQVSYTQFRDLVKNMAPGFANDEPGLYKAALAAGKAFRIPQSEVLRGVDAILGELAQAEHKFKEAAPQRLAVKVGARRDKISEIKRAYSSKQEEIRRFQEMIVRLNSEVVQMVQAEQVEQSAISQDEQSVREDTEKFLAALEAVRAPYVAERQKIELYGGRG